MGRGAARDLNGSTPFVSITHVAYDGSLVEMEEDFCVAEFVEARPGIKLIQSAGAPYVLAPLLVAIEAGDPDFDQLSEAHELLERPTS